MVTVTYDDATRACRALIWLQAQATFRGLPYSICLHGNPKTGRVRLVTKLPRELVSKLPVNLKFGAIISEDI